MTDHIFEEFKLSLKEAVAISKGEKQAARRTKVLGQDSTHPSIDVNSHGLLLVHPDK